MIAWIWARTVPSPDPAAGGAHVPLISTYWLSKKRGAEAWLEPVVDVASSSYKFRVHNSAPPDGVSVGTGTKVGRADFQCILTGASIPRKYICEKGQTGQLGRMLLATVVKARRGRLYVEASSEQTDAAFPPLPDDYPVTDLPDSTDEYHVQHYGILQHWQMFTERQLVAMVTLSDSIREIASEVQSDAVTAGLPEEEVEDYATAVITFLALVLNRVADLNNTCSRWVAITSSVHSLFSRQAVPMVWDFPEANTLGSAVGSWLTCVKREANCMATILAGDEDVGSARQADAASGANGIQNLIVSTDPPYYDNIGYAVLSDFFYIWLRRTLGDSYGDLFGTVLTPKDPELTADPERFDDDEPLAKRKSRAKKHFEDGFSSAFAGLRKSMDPRFPLTVYYAFKQGGSQSKKKKATTDLTTGWETLLEALISAGFQITATWPVRASYASRLLAIGSNALGSYIVFACRPRPANAPQTTSVQFRNELKETLPDALRHMQQGNIAPVDFAQAAIGPGMSIYSRYKQIRNSEGERMRVRDALGVINRTLTEVLSEHEDEYDRDTRWAITWFGQKGFNEGDFGDADALCRAYGTSVEGLHQAGIVKRGGGKVRLIKPDELPADWDPETDKRLTVWEMTHHLLRLYHFENVGEHATADLLRKIGADGEVARELAYRLFDICERKKWSQEAQGYNALVLGWTRIADLAREAPKLKTQDTLTLNGG